MGRCILKPAEVTGVEEAIMLVITASADHGNDLGMDSRSA